MAGALISNVAP